MPTTHEKATVQETKSGPAEYLGGAPMPDEHSAAKPVVHKPQHEDSKEHKHGVMAKAHAALAKIEHAVENKFHKKPESAEDKWFRAAFPNMNDDHVYEVYRVVYIDGKPTEHDGKLAITTKAIHFADSDEPSDSSTSLSALYPVIASLVIEAGDEKVLAMYTTDRKVLKFKAFHSDAPEHTDTDDTMQEAYQWIDYLWRKNTHVPNRAAMYCSS